MASCGNRNDISSCTAYDTYMYQHLLINDTEYIHQFISNAKKQKQNPKFCEKSKT
jgi:hypothetical protein